MVAALAEKIWKQHYTAIITMGQIEYMLDKMYSRESMLKQLQEGHEFTLVFADGVPVGYAAVSKKGRGNYFIHKFYVDVAEHSKGIGSRLLQHILESLPDAETLELTVNRKNFKAINFYFKNGFTIREVADFDIGNNYFMNDFIMVKKIS